MKTPPWPSIRNIVQVMMKSNYLGMCSHVDAASVLVGHLALLLRHLMLLICIIFVVRFIITTKERLIPTSGGISWSTPLVVAISSSVLGTGHTEPDSFFSRILLDGDGENDYDGPE